MKDVEFFEEDIDIAVSKKKYKKENPKRKLMIYITIISVVVMIGLLFIFFRGGTSVDTSQNFIPAEPRFQR